jgi:hypothetical protein
MGVSIGPQDLCQWYTAQAHERSYERESCSDIQSKTIIISSRIAICAV